MSEEAGDAGRFGGGDGGVEVDWALDGTATVAAAVAIVEGFNRLTVVNCQGIITVCNGTRIVFVGKCPFARCVYIPHRSVCSVRPVKHTFCSVGR